MIKMICQNVKNIKFMKMPRNEQKNKFTSWEHDTEWNIPIEMWSW